MQLTYIPSIQETADEQRRLRGGRLLAARAAYLGLFALAVGLFAAGIPVFRHSTALGSIGARMAYTGAGETLIISRPGMNAAEAGLRPGDVLLQVDGTQVHVWHSRKELAGLIRGPSGSPVVLTVRGTDGETRVLQVMRDVRGIDQLGLSAGTYALLMAALAMLLFVGYGFPALILFMRRSDDWLAMFVSMTLILLGGAVANVYEVFGVFRPEWSWLTNTVLFLSAMSSVCLFYIFPDGRFVPAWSWVVVPLAALEGVLELLPPPVAPIAWPAGLGVLPTVLFYCGGVLAQIYRYRHVSGTIERQQTKWVVYGMAVAVVGALAYEVPGSILSSLQEPTATAFRYQLVGQTLESVALLAFPIALAVSILRYRLYHIDLIINRTLVYVPLTAILAGLLAVASDMSKRTFDAFLGGSPESSVILTTLVIVAAFDPIRRSFQNQVDKHFKEVPNPQKRLAAFCKSLEQRLFRSDEAELLRELLAEAATAFEVHSAAVFGRDGAPLHATRLWDGAPRLSVPVLADPVGQAHGEIALGPRKNGSGYSERDRAALQQACQAVAQAIEADDAAVLQDGSSDSQPGSKSS